MLVGHHSHSGCNIEPGRPQVLNYRRHSIVVIGDDDDRSLGFGPPLPAATSGQVEPSAASSSSGMGSVSAGKGSRELGRVAQQVNSTSPCALLSRDFDGPSEAASPPPDWLPMPGRAGQRSRGQERRGVGAVLRGGGRGAHRGSGRGERGRRGRRRGGGRRPRAREPVVGVGVGGEEGQAVLDPRAGARMRAPCRASAPACSRLGAGPWRPHFPFPPLALVPNHRAPLCSFHLLGTKAGPHPSTGARVFGESRLNGVCSRGLTGFVLNGV